MSRSKNLKGAAAAAPPLLITALGGLATVVVLFSSDFMQRATAGPGSYIGEMGSSRHVEFVAGSIQDVDTFRVMDGTQEIEVKLCGIDAPVAEQKSVSRLHELVARSGDSGNIILVPVATDTNGRLVAEVFIPLPPSVGEQEGQEVHLNSQLLSEGVAALRSQEVNACPNSSVMKTAEQSAQSQNKGIWKEHVGEGL